MHWKGKKLTDGSYDYSGLDTSSKWTGLHIVYYHCSQLMPLLLLVGTLTSSFQTRRPEVKPIKCISFYVNWLILPTKSETNHSVHWFLAGRRGGWRETAIRFKPSPSRCCKKWIHSRQDFTGELLPLSANHGSSGDSTVLLLSGFLVFPRRDRGLGDFKHFHDFLSIQIWRS